MVYAGIPNSSKNLDLEQKTMGDLRNRSGPVLLFQVGRDGPRGIEPERGPIHPP